MVLSREQILTTSDLKSVDIEVPEWGGSVRMRMLTGIESDEYERHLNASDKADLTHMTLLLSMCLVDGDGNYLFPRPDGPNELQARSAVVRNRLFLEAIKLNSASPELIEEQAKNLIARQGDTQDSSLDSASSSASPAEESFLEDSTPKTSPSGKRSKSSSHSDQAEKSIALV